MTGLTIAALDMPPTLSITLAAILLLAAAWYWHHLGESELARSTRAIRRGSLLLSALAIFALVRGASFVDSEQAPDVYVTTWLAALALVFLVLLMIGIDLAVSFRLYRRDLEEEAMHTATKLRGEIAKLESTRTEREEDSS